MPATTFENYTVRIKWCGLDIERTAPDFTLAGLYVSSTSDPSANATYTQGLSLPAFRTESGYIDVQIIHLGRPGDYVAQSFLFPQPTPTLFFKPGGGISLSFIP